MFGNEHLDRLDTEKKPNLYNNPKNTLGKRIKGREE